MEMSQDDAVQASMDEVDIEFQPITVEEVR